jgi:hypothetical protein
MEMDRCKWCVLAGLCASSKASEHLQIPYLHGILNSN